jgi:hypothetical protein
MAVDLSADSQHPAVQQYEGDPAHSPCFDHSAVIIISSVISRVSKHLPACGITRMLPPLNLMLTLTWTWRLNVSTASSKVMLASL